MSKHMLELVDVFICNMGAYINTDQLNDSQETYIKNKFTIRNKNIMGHYDIIKCYSYKKINDKVCLLLPRFSPFYLQGKIKMRLHNNIINGDKVEYNLDAKFMGNQKIVYDDIFNTYLTPKFVKMGLSGVIINLEAGQGKTFLALHIIKKVQLKAFIVVHNELMLKQWEDVITKYIKNITIGVWYGKKKIDGDITIGIINSALHYDKWESVGICIFDEAHLYSSKGRSEVFKLCQSTYMIGLSATPDEKKEKGDNSYKLIEWNIGKILKADILEGYNITEIPFTAQVYMIKYKGPPQFTRTLINEKLEMVSIPKMTQQLTEDPYRIQLIIYLVKLHLVDKNLVDKNSLENMNLFIFANRREYLEQIHQKLRLTFETLFLTSDDDANKIMNIMGNSKADDVNKAEKYARIILTTYQYFGTGKSIPRMNAMILATPFKFGARQYINRIFRIGSDYNIKRIIIDIVDWSTVFKSQWYTRKKYYDEKQYPISIVEYEWNCKDFNRIILN